MNIEINVEAIWETELFGYPIGITRSVILEWIFMVVIIALALIFTRNLKKIPSKRQTVVEMVVGLFNGLVSSNIGPSYRNTFVSYIGTMGIFIFILNCSGLYGIEPTTKDINVTMAFAITSFCAINGFAIATGGIGKYLLSFFKPYPFMLPMNIVEKVSVPFSLTLRLFINMLVGAIFLELIYHALEHIYFPFIFPAPLHFFFDLFVAIIQTYVFMLITMVNIKLAAEHH